ncbi:hypothetical protein KC340_g165 [Hortaea werneckii]|nr:hypothetical protein KC340_g165 [Hortaea werneckii]
MTPRIARAVPILGGGNAKPPVKGLAVIGLGFAFRHIARSREEDEQQRVEGPHMHRQKAVGEECTKYITGPYPPKGKLSLDW